MFGDLDWPLNAPRGLSAIAEFLVPVHFDKTWPIRKVDCPPLLCCWSTFAHNVMGSSVAQWPHRPKIWGQSLKPFSPNLVNRAWGTYNTYDYKFEPYSILDSTQCRVESNQCRSTFSSMTLTGVWRAFLSCDWPGNVDMSEGNVPANRLSSAWLGAWLGGYRAASWDDDWHSTCLISL